MDCDFCGDCQLTEAAKAEFGFYLSNKIHHGGSLYCSNFMHVENLKKLRFILFFKRIYFIHVPWYEFPE